jgi:cyclo(L-tyrosyl-L-tyrosyl) synthase
MMSCTAKVTEECLNPLSEELFNIKEHALIGISPFNGFFTEYNLEKIFAWAIDNFKEISVFIPDEISAYTLQAAGYSEDKAQKKTARQDRYLKHKAIRALMANGLLETEAESKMLYLSYLTKNKRYIEVYNNCMRLFDTDKSFKDGCLATSKWVLDGKSVQGVITDESLEIAVKYFLAELPLYLDTPGILGTPSSLFVYKDAPSEFLKKIYAENLLVAPRQGYLAIVL